MNPFGMDYQGSMNSTSSNNYDGGYTNTNTMMESPAKSQQQAPRKSREEQTLIPVTIRMILCGSNHSSGEEWCLMDGRELDKVQLVAAVRSVEKFSTHYTFALEDGTGLLEVKCWANADSESLSITELREQAAVDNTYVRAIGKVKEYEGKVSMVADSIQPVTNPNVITHHMLQVIHSGETHKRSNRIGAAPSHHAPSNHTTTTLFNSPSPAKNTLSLHGGMAMSSPGTNSGLQEDLMTFFRQSANTSETGGHIQEFYNLSKQKYSMQQIRDATSDLASEGLIYSTTDEETFTIV